MQYHVVATADDTVLYETVLVDAWDQEQLRYYDLYDDEAGPAAEAAELCATVHAVDAAGNASEQVTTCIPGPAVAGDGDEGDDDSADDGEDDGEDDGLAEDDGESGDGSEPSDGGAADDSLDRQGCACAADRSAPGAWLLLPFVALGAWRRRR